MTPTQKELEKTKDALVNSQYAVKRLEGMVEEQDKRIERFDSKQENNFSVIKEQHYEMMSQLSWMRRLVELMVVPKEKMEELARLQNEIEITNDRGRIRNY
jgi:hypothetical protein